MIYAADDGGLIFLKDGARSDIVTIEHWKNGMPRAAMLGEIGHPYMIAAVDDSRLLYTDERNGNIMYFDSYEGALRPLTGSGRNDTRNDETGFADGPLSTALASDPEDIAADGSGAFLFADTGNRRVRRISGMNFRDAEQPSDTALSVSSAPRGRYRIAMIGNSMVWDDTIWDDSIEARLENDLNEEGRDVWVDPIRVQNTSLHSTFDYIDQVIVPTHRDDLVILFLNHGMFHVEGDDNWENVLLAELPVVARHLREEGIRFAVAFHPMAIDVLWAEYPLLEINGEGNALVPGGAIAHDRTMADLRKTGVPILDLWPAFYDAEREPNHRPLYGTDDKHFTEAGRAVAGDAIAKLVVKYLPPPHRSK